MRVRRGQLLPADAWYCAGSVWELPTWQEVLAHGTELVSKGVLDSISALEGSSRGRTTRQSAGVFEARWSAPGGAPVRARLVVRAAGDGGAAGPGQCTPSGGSVSIAALADQEWDATWPSPASMFLPRSLVWGPDIGMEYLGANGISRYLPKRVDVVLEELERLPWCTMVITHDPRTFDVANRERGTPPLARLMPAGLLGRVVELRVFGSDCTPADLHLRQKGLELNWGGATIVLPGDVRARAAFTHRELCVRSTPGVLDGGDRSQLASTLCRIADIPWPMNSRAQAELEELRESPGTGGLPAPVPAVTPEQQISALTTRLEEIQTQLSEQQHRHKAELDALRLELDENTLRRELDELRAEAGGFEEDLIAADALLDDQARRIAWLQRELAKTGRPYGEDLAQDDVGAPASWRELFGAADSFAHLALADVDDQVMALRGHPSEPTWLRRTWEALRALNAYAQAKAARGADEVPHFSAYLQLPDAGFVIPSYRYRPAESGTVMTNRKLRDARVFPIARGTEPERVFMSEHIRIGSGSPPAPRLYFFDDTAGSSKIHVGYIGKHLPNLQTN